MQFFRYFLYSMLKWGFNEGVNHSKTLRIQSLIIEMTCSAMSRQIVVSVNELSLFSASPNPRIGVEGFRFPIFRDVWPTLENPSVTDVALIDTEMSFRKIGWKKVEIKTTEKDYRCRKVLLKHFNEYWLRKRNKS